MTVTIALFYITFVKNLPVKHVQIVRVYNRSEQNGTASWRMSQVAPRASFTRSLQTVNDETNLVWLHSK
jgi:hypothetical protein